MSMTFYEISHAKNICDLYVRWNGWGPPTSDYSIQEFCRAKSNSATESKEYREILIGWMDGLYDFEIPLWLQD